VVLRGERAVANRSIPFGRSDHGGPGFYPAVYSTSSARATQSLCSARCQDVDGHVHGVRCINCISRII
jgi:hypothetical protein